MLPNEREETENADDKFNEEVPPEAEWPLPNKGDDAQPRREGVPRSVAHVDARADKWSGSGAADTL